MAGIGFADLYVLSILATMNAGWPSEKLLTYMTGSAKPTGNLIKEILGQNSLNNLV